MDFEEQEVVDMKKKTTSTPGVFELLKLLFYGFLVGVMVAFGVVGYRFVMLLFGM